ncbi:aminoglycoside phosphotransferase family protein [Streptomyces sp. NPDC050264]|uniref:aminoglycoside phosphotransferase family protein n=1 Tax=Streptomyces sp. NPDC050264 TaxID=3155038 RepID=UPI003413263F
MGVDLALSPRTRAEASEEEIRRLWDSVIAGARRSGEELSGHHNLNRVVQLSDGQAAALGRPAGSRVMVRHRKRDVPPVVIRTWPDEQAVLDAISGLGHVPQCLARRGDIAIHSYMEGTPLAGVCRDGKPVDSLLIDAFTGLLADMTRVPGDRLPPRPSHWPRDGDSRGFLRRLAAAADDQIRQPNWTGFGGLFVALGVPENALRLYAHWAPELTPRPFGLLHGDLHRDNVIVTYDGEPPLMCVDWELATYGDPLHDLAVHLVRMRYPTEQRAEVVDRWREAMGRVRPEAVRGLADDLPHYIDFERAQSVYPDVIRAVGSLGDTFTQSDLEAASEEVHRALLAARRQFRLRDVMDAAAIEPLLFRWRVARGARHRGRLFSAAINWRRDERVPLRAPFSEAEVEEALWAEGAATARQVFKGTAHLGTVVEVGGFAAPVMVRRKVGTDSPIEPRFLDEHAVLRAIEDAGVAVGAPKVLALGVSDFGEPFTIHTYEGPSDICRRPRHPVHGLLPGEAHDLVDQLRQLIDVDPWSLAQDTKGSGFYGWLSGQLVDMVAELSRTAKELAARLGLPDAVGLDRRLRRHEVRERPYVLLHGDLNPWNLVRGERGFGLTLIDWEMAMVGDPLYDLVRHIHLTPTTREIRDRMYSRWQRLMPERFTAGWERDVPVYRGLELVRSAYVDLDRLVTGSGLDAPNVRRAVGSYTTTLHKALKWLGMPPGSWTAANPYLALALPHADDEAPVPSSP